jgi:hypothetical protein
MVVHGHRKLALGRFLADHVLIEEIFYFQRFGDFVLASGGRFRLIIFKDRIADCNTLVADISPRIIARGRYQFSYDILALMTKRTA